MLRTGFIHITPEILSLIARINEFKGAWRVLGTLTPDRLSALRHVASIESIGQHVFKVCRPQLRKDWYGGRKQPLCVSNTVKSWICEFLMNGDAGTIAEKDGIPVFF